MSLFTRPDAMADVAEVTSTDAVEVLATGRRHLAVKEYGTAVSTLGRACQLLAEKHGEQADQCADAYLWYGKALLGLSREESGVLGDRVPQGEGDTNQESDDEQDENGEDEAEGEVAENGDSETKTEDKPEAPEGSKQDEKKEEDPAKDTEQPGASNGEENADESAADLGDEDDVDNLQLAWEMLELSRSILAKRVAAGGGDAARALLADVHLTLGEVALESETYDKAVLDMQSCLEIQKELYKNDDRRIAETHYQIALANSLSSNFEEAITHFTNAANILESRARTLESPAAAQDAAVRKHAAADAHYSPAAEARELRELLPEIRERIQDMLDYKAETIRRVREQLAPSLAQGPSRSNGGGAEAAGAAPAGAAGAAPPKASDISHLIKRKRKSSEGEGGAPSKNAKP